MKMNLLITLFTGLFLLNGIQAQTQKPLLDQMQALIGNWQQVISQDSLEIIEIQQYENAFVANNYLVVNSKKSFNFGVIYVYSPKEDKLRGFWFRPSGSYTTFLTSFISEKKLRSEFVQNFNPEKALYAAEMEFESKESYNVIFYNLDGTKRGVYKWTKIK